MIERAWQIESPESVESSEAVDALVLLDRPASLEATAQPSAYASWGKRALDLTLGLPLALISAPVVLVLAGLVLATDGQPAFYKARRLGRGGREFNMWKLRTMIPDAERRLAALMESDEAIAAEFEVNFKLRNDPRVTRLGRFLRRTSLDELPQLLNVLRGEMSLVGPRPIVRNELPFYSHWAPQFLAARPGITGNWQLGGRNAIDYPERASIELHYCNAISLKHDLSLLARSVFVPFRGDGV